MANPEIVYRHDYVDGLVVVRGLTVVHLVEELVSQTGYFLIYQKTTGADTGHGAYIEELRQYPHKYLIAKWGGATHLLLSDPFDSFDGGIAIAEKALIYSPRAIGLHLNRDMYKYGGIPINNYFVRQGFLDTVEEFLENGYAMYSSDFVEVDNPSRPIGQQEQINSGDLIVNPPRRPWLS